MKSKYKSSKSVAKNQTVPISADDPRVAWDKVGQTKARQGAEIDIIGLDGKSLVAGGTKLTNPTGTSGVDTNKSVVGITIPPINNQPPSTYPGGSGATVIIPTDPTSVTASWSGEDLVVQFEWDYKNEFNITISQFILELTADGITRRTPLNTFLPNKTQNTQTAILTKSLNRLTFGVFRTSITSICVIAADPFNNVSQQVCATAIPTYVLDLPIPTVSVASISNGYSLSYTTPTQTSYDAIDIWEIEDLGTTAPAIVYAADGTTPTNYKRSYFGNLNPANVISQNYNKRWVIARFSSSGGAFTAFSTAQTVTPTSPVSLDLTPPNEVSQIVTSWSGDNIIVAYKLPAQEAGSRVQIELTSPNSLVGFFYRFPDGSGRDQTTTITKKDLFDQFGEHYSSFTGVLRSIDASDNRSAGVSFNVDTRPNPMDTVTPTLTLTPLTNGYSVFASNYSTTVGISYMEVYAKHTPWVGDPINDDDVVYAGANPAVIIDTDYTTVYIKIRYYDDFGNTSLYSIEDTVVPLGPGDITSFETPITFGANGVIYAGGDYTSGHRTVFKTSGIFAYDSSSTSPTTGLTTQIISEASSGTPTFITTRAQIADWNITDTKIENDLSGTPSKYTGLSATGPYAFWAGSDVSGGDSSSKFTVTPTGEVTAREITIIGNGSPSSSLISAGGLFTVKNDGTFTATGADIQGKITADSGSIDGNLTIGIAGALTSGTVGQSTGNTGYILANEGLRFDYGTTQGITSINGLTGLFTTKSANIGGWTIDETSIKKTGISGKGNINLDSSNGYITVSNPNIASSLAGINSPGNNLSHSVFWAGGTDPNSTANPFRVTLGGALYAQEAIISGTITSTGALGTMKMDGDDGFISLTTSSKASYLIPRNGNIYLTSPSISDPWTSPTGGKPIATSGPTTGPYFVAGSSFKDYWGTTVNGIGIYTGDWDYFSAASGTAANTASKPFMSATDTGIQLSANAQVGIIIDRGSSATGNKLEPAITNGQPGILIYTGKQATAPWSPSSSYGAWAAFTENDIRLSAATPTYIDLNATTQVITIASGTGNVVSSGIGQNLESPRAYDGPSRISLDPVNGVVLSGIKVQGNIDMNDWEADGNLLTPAVGTRYHPYADDSYYLIGDGTTQVYPNGSYRNAPPLGKYPRQRMMVEDPATGEMMLGMAVYYKPVTSGTTTPSASTGYAGDLLVQY